MTPVKSLGGNKEAFSPQEHSVGSPKYGRPDLAAQDC
jgi:hypothetical protein